MVLALLIHFILLSSPRFNWLGDPAAGTPMSMQMDSVQPQSRLFSDNNG
jgi:hypothetical protein